MNKLYTILSCAAAIILFGGCSSTNASYVESGGSRSVISTDKINIADWNNASASLVNDMLSAGVLEKFKQPVKMKVSRVINRTTRNIETSLLTQQICIALNNSGKVLAMSDDAATNELAEYEAFMKGQNSVSSPKITMTGKIIEDRESNSDVNEVTYIFMLEVNNGGVQVWSGQKQITKQAEKGWF